MKMKQINWKDVAVRAAKTFVQTAVSVLIAGLSGVDLFEQAQGFWIGLLLSAGSAGVSAVWNGMVGPAIGGMQRKHGDDSI